MLIVSHLKARHIVVGVVGGSTAPTEKVGSLCSEHVNGIKEMK